MPAALIALCLGGWFWDAGYVWLWPLLVVGCIFGPSLLSGLIELVHKPAERGWLLHLALTGKSTARPLVRALLGLAFLPYEALVNSGRDSPLGRQHAHHPARAAELASALIHTAERPEHTRRIPGGDVDITPPGRGLGGGTRTSLQTPGSTEWPFVAPFALLWLFAPLAAWWISQPVRPPSAALDSHQQMFLRAVARRTWRFFTDFVGPDDNWLPPDNYQEYPTAAVAHRTSPTNMGMALLANLTAFDFGYIGGGELLRRTKRAFRTMEKLERFRGHFRNWYDTQTLEPLLPEYVSAVDSGNLASSLLVLSAGLEELKNRPILSPARLPGHRGHLAGARGTGPRRLRPPDLQKQTAGGA